MLLLLVHEIGDNGDNGDGCTPPAPTSAIVQNDAASKSTLVRRSKTDALGGLGEGGGDGLRIDGLVRATQRTAAVMQALYERVRFCGLFFDIRSPNYRPCKTARTPLQPADGRLPTTENHECVQRFGANGRKMTRSISTGTFSHSTYGRTRESRAASAPMFVGPLFPTTESFRASVIYSHWPSNWCDC
uniref:Uncharacterized protein n=1 Tax=Plectus sambesii TaxID=2011161 RepID=A0A914XF31_9BILA